MVNPTNQTRVGCKKKRKHDLCLQNSLLQKAWGRLFGAYSIVGIYLFEGGEGEHHCWLGNHVKTFIYIYMYSSTHVISECQIMWGWGGGQNSKSLNLRLLGVATHTLLVVCRDACLVGDASPLSPPPPGAGGRGGQPGGRGGQPGGGPGGAAGTAHHAAAAAAADVGGGSVGLF